MASSWNIWQIRALQVDIRCSKNSPTRGNSEPGWEEMSVFSAAFSWHVAQGDMSPNLAIVTKSNYISLSICLLFSRAILFSESQLLGFSFDTRTLHLGIVTSRSTNGVWHSGVSAVVQSQLSLCAQACGWVLRRISVRSGLKGQWIFLSRRSWHCDHCYCTYRE